MATDPHAKVLFNDGEGLQHADLNLLQMKLEARQLEVGGFDGSGGIGLAIGQGDSVEGVHASSPNLGEFATANWVPFGSTPLARINPARTALNIAGGCCIQDVAGGTPGTPPTGASTTLAYRGLDTRNMVTDLTGDAAPGSGNPRWDAWGIRLGYEQEEATARDFKDGSTDALTSTTPDKEERITAETEFVVGSQAAAYEVPTMTSGFRPIVTKRRAVGESSPYTANDFYYHAYPTRLGIEDVFGQEMTTSGVGEADWFKEAQAAGEPYLVKNAAGAGYVIAWPRTLHAGCRLIGVGVCMSESGEDTNILIRRDTFSGTTGLWSSATIGDIGNGGPLGGDDGFSVAGEADWSGSDILPIWGNGTTYGPMYQPESAGPIGQDVTRLSVRLEENTSWADATKIHFVRFYYLY